MTRQPAIDLSTPRRIHLIGVGGTGMSSVATALSGMGHSVTGSEIKALPVLDRLRPAGVTVHLGHDESYVEGVDAVAYSSAVPEQNIELEAARHRNVTVLTRAQLLAAMGATRRTVAIAGTHGKTTSASMLASILIQAGMRPSFVIGGELNDLGTGGLWDEGDWLILEADESDGSFLALEPEIGVITNVEPDHLEWYGSFEALAGAFDTFFEKVSRIRFACADYPGSARLAAKFGALTYGTAKTSDYRVVSATGGREGVSFELLAKREPLGRVHLDIPGTYNALNAAAAVSAGLAVGVDFDTCRRALAGFQGVARRFELRGASKGITFMDDYAHLPSEVEAAISAALEGGWNRLVCVFQPHRYSRTEALWAQFANAFSGADVVVVTDVYAAGEPARPGVSGELIAGAVFKAHPSLDVRYRSTREDLVKELVAVLAPGDLCLTLGAGDLTSLPDELMERL